MYKNAPAHRDLIFVHHSMCETGFPSLDWLACEAYAKSAPKHSVVLTHLSERSDLDASQISALPLDFLSVVVAEVLRSNLCSIDSPYESAALQVAAACSFSCVPTPGSADVFLRSFVESFNCCMALNAIASQRVRLVELCLSLPVWGKCKERHITALLESMQMSPENVRDELISSLLLCCSHYERSDRKFGVHSDNAAGDLPPGLHGGDKWCEDLFHSLAAFCRLEENACIMACEGVFHLVMRCLPHCRTPGSQRWCITAAANLCLTDNGRLLFVRPEFVMACNWLSHNALHAEVERWLATCIMNILYTKPLPRLFSTPKAPAISREAFETLAVRDMLIRMAKAAHSRIISSSSDPEREAIFQAVTSCFSALVNLAINFHFTEPESRLDMCVTPEMVQLILHFGTECMAEDVLEMVAALMRIMAASELCKQSFSCVAFRDMFTRLLTRRLRAETKLKLLGALVLMFENNPVPFSDNVALFGDSNFRNAVLGSHLAVSSSTPSIEIIGILDSVNIIKRRCS